MRRLSILVGTVVLVDAIFYAALAPILPDLADEFGLSKAQSGFLVAAYAAGTMAGALPAGWLVARVGARPVLVTGMLVMSVAGLFFALANSIALLDGARFVQGLGGACSWTAGLAWLGQTARPERRGAVIGAAIGAGTFGAQFGPVLGGVAEAVGRGPAFGVMALSGLGLAAWAMTAPAPSIQTGSGTMRQALRDRRFLSAMWLTLLPAVCFGVAEVLGPLRLSALGATTLAIAVVFFLAALVEAAAAPISGRLADRRGTQGVVLVGLLAGAAALLAISVPSNWVVVGVLLVVFGATLGLLWAPSGKLVSVNADRLKLDQGYAFAINNLMWAGGIALGAAAGGGLGEAFGDWVPYSVGAALCLGTAGLWRSGRQVASVPSGP